MTSFVNWNTVTSAVDDLTVRFSAGHMSVLKRWFKDKSLWSVCFDFSSYFQSLTMAFQRSTLTTSGEFSETELKCLFSWLESRPPFVEISQGQVSLVQKSQHSHSFLLSLISLLLLSFPSFLELDVSFRTDCSSQLSFLDSNVPWFPDMGFEPRHIS